MMSVSQWTAVDKWMSYAGFASCTLQRYRELFNLSRNVEGSHFSLFGS